MTPRFASSDIRRHRPGIQALYNLPDIHAPKDKKTRHSPNWYARVALILTFALLGLTTRSAWAAEYEVHDEDQDGSSWGLGLGVGVMQKAYRGIDTDTIAIPIIIYDSEWIGVRGGSISLKLPSAGPVSFALSADFSNDGYEASDSDFLAGMDEREDNFWLGATAKWETSVADFSTTWSTDVSGNSEGQKFAISAERAFESGNFEFAPRLGAQWLDDNYVNYYYGVRAHEATPDRSFYVPDSTVNFEAGFRTTYKLPAYRSSVFLDLSVHSLGSSIADSPLVDGSTEERIFVGFVRMF
jgi:outer membrane scaffolding protein for murein synthesis (MipA/OmpV family)